MNTGKTITYSILAMGLAALPLYGAHAAETSGLDKGASQLEQLFGALDMDKSGTVTMKEYMAYHNRRVSPEFGEYFEFRAIDADDSQTLSKTELRNATDPFDPKL